MKILLKNLEKKDVQFLFAMVIFALLVACRCLGAFVNIVPVPFGVFIEYTKVSCVTILYFLGFIFFYLVVILKNETKMKKDMYYFVTFLSVFVFPMFVASSYFGNREVVGWVFVLFSIFFILFEQAEWMTIPSVVIMSWFCPISVFCCVCVILALLLYQYFAKNKIKYLLYAVINFFLAAAIFLFQFLTAKEFDNEAVYGLTLTKFIVVIILMSPYLIIAISFFKGWLRRIARTKKKFGLIAIFLGILPSILVDICIEDYSKAFFHVFVYFILIVTCLITMKEEAVLLSYQDTKKKILEWVPIPSVVLVYPFIFMIIWISGFTPMFEESVIGF